MTHPPQHTAARLDLDERAVLLRPPGTFLPAHLGRAQWSLEKAGLLAPSHARPRRVALSPEGRAVRLLLRDGWVDTEHGWGVKLTGRGEDSWWRPDGKGYTLDVSQAGLYSRERAHQQHGWGRANVGSPRDVAVPPARMRELVDTAVAKARYDLARAERASAALGGAP